VTRDLRVALRSLLASPTFTAVAVVTLALGIGASTAGFSLANWLLFRPLPGVRNGHRIAVVWFGSKRSDGPAQLYPVMPSELATISAGVPALRGFAGHTAGQASVSSARRSLHVDLEFVMPKYFALLGTRPQLGRLLQPDDDSRPSGLPVALIGYDLWRELFDSDPSVVGKSLRINTRVFTVVGVAPEGFQGVDRSHPVDLWLPGRASLALGAARGAQEPFYSEFVSRLAQGATFDEAERQLRAATERAFGESPILFRGVGVWPPIRTSAHGAARLLLAITGLILLIACANTANLLLFRGLTRRSQSAMRKVLGATLSQLVRSHVLESLLLGAAGGALGVFIGRWLVDAFQGLSLWRGAAPLEHVPLDWRVTLFASIAAFGSALGAGAAPAFLAARTEPMQAVRASAATQTHGGSLRRIFAGVQMAVSFTLLVGALLVVRTLRNLNRITLGFDPNDVSAVSVAPVDVGYAQGRLQAYYRQLLQGVQEVPGIESAALGSSIPLSRGTFMMNRVVPSGSAADAAPITVVTTSVSPGYFMTLGIPLIAGRAFLKREFLRPPDSQPPVAVISRSLARGLFGNRNPVGRYIGRDPHVEVVGVVGDTRVVDLEEFRGTPWREGEMMYVPMQVPGATSVAVLVRSRRPHAKTMAAIRAVAAQIDPSVPLYNDLTLNEAIRRYLADRIVFARLLTVLSALAVGLAALGLSGLVAYTVGSRTREIGIRIALGAPTRRIVSLLWGEGIVIALSGTGVGLCAAIALAGLLKSRLYGLSAYDPGTYVLAATVLLSATLLASLVPTRAATRVDPISVLRSA
jgi:predicted permease